MNVTPEFRPILESRLASVLSARPPVVAAFDSDLVRRRAAFAAFARANSGAVFLLQLGYEHETPELAAELAGHVAAFCADAPGTRVIALGNSARECDSLRAAGVEARFVHQNCFLDERRYRPMGRRRPFDAAYIARFTPCKRHELVPVDMAPRLLLLGCFTYDSERAYADMIHARYASARMVGEFSGARVSELLGLAKCGLVLSAREGASFCSSEYLLCGIPVVDTPALGGRSVLYPEEYVRYVDATPDAVGEGVGHWVQNRPDPWKIRSAWLAKARPHREAFGQLMRELTGRAHGHPPHKLGLRTPHPAAAYSRAIQAYLWAKGIFMP